MKPATDRLAALILLAGLAAMAHAQPTLTQPAAGMRAFDEPVVTKYQLMSSTGAKHAGGVMRWYYNDANRPTAITKANAISRIQSAMGKWTAVCKITFQYQGETTAGFSLQQNPPVFDGTNVIGWDPTNIAAPTTGITNIAWDGNNNIIDSEIRLNAAYSATVTGFDATIVHEIGHSIGLAHSDLISQVMSGPPLTSYTGLSLLQSDDVAGCVHLYGAAGGSGPPADTQAPSVPMGLTATAAGPSEVDLSWNASTDNVGVTSYKVYSGSTLLGSTSNTAASVTGLVAGVQYTFSVSACDAAGNCSAQSTPVMVSTQPGDTQPPTVPTNLVAAPLSSTQIQLTWTASTDNVGVMSYKVYVGGSLLGSVVSPSALINSLAPSTTYTFTVSACDAAGNCSAQSGQASATTMSAPQGCTGSQPPNDTQVIACPAGQVGSITQTRSYSCVGSTWTPGAYQTTSNSCTIASTPTSYQDMWWVGPQENGWGLTVTQHNDTLFLAWYIYDANGNPYWIVMPGGTWNAGHTSYSGALYVPTGSWYGNYDTTRFAAGASVGTASITFSSTSTATFSYTVGGVSASKAITRMLFGPVNTAPITNYTDMWWGGTSQDGWGVVLTQQYHNIFGAWYTYDASGKTTWFVMPDGSWTGNTYSGALYSTKGAPVLNGAYNASALVVTQVGTLSIAFTDANNATMTYSVNGLTQTKSISRLAF